MRADTWTGRHEVLEEAAALFMLLHRIPAAQRAPTAARLYGVFLEQFGGLPGVEADVGIVAAARDEFYAMPAAELAVALQGWSPVATRPPLADVMNHQGYLRLARVLSIDADNPKDLGPAVRFTHRFAGVPGYAAVRVEIQEGTSRAAAMACMQQIVRLLIDRWPEMIDRDKLAGVGVTLSPEQEAAYRGPVVGVEQQ